MEVQVEVVGDKLQRIFWFIIHAQACRSGGYSSREKNKGEKRTSELHVRLKWKLVAAQSAQSRKRPAGVAETRLPHYGDFKSKQIKWITSKSLNHIKFYHLLPALCPTTQFNTKCHRKLRKLKKVRKAELRRDVHTAAKS